MQLLNLKPGFEPYGPGTARLSRSHVFAGGEADIQIDAASVGTDELLITTRLNSSADVMELLMATDALREMGVEKMHVFFPYVPYARQDRAVRHGEAFALRVFADLINAQQYASVRFFDAHSDVTPALIRRSHSESNHAFVSHVLRKAVGHFWLLSPDSGAFKKVSHLADSLGYDGEIALCNKVRIANDAIGSVTITVPDFLGRDVYIVDDICDGGRTFIALAAEIRARNAGNIFLVVSHAILSYGEEPLKSGGIDHIFTTDSFKPLNSPYITQVKLCDILTPTTTRA